MELGFWEKFKNRKEPFFVMAPMADVTDPAFRRIIAKYSRHGEPNGGPDVFWTEFVSADGLMSPGRAVLKRDLDYTEAERPIVAQLFGSNPEKMLGAATLVRELGFDGLDINMGCPDRSIEKQGAGAAMMKNPERACEIIRAAKEGMRDRDRQLPVSVKTRLGFNKDEYETWIPELLKEDIAALTIHARTRKEMSKVPARWDHVARVVEIVRASGKETLVIGNGDVRDIEDGFARAKASGVDGIMIGRGIFGNPWLFDQSRTPESITLHEKLSVMVEHTKLYEELLGDVKNFSIMKKHYKAYVNNFEGAAELRAKLMETQSAGEVDAIVAEFFTERDITV